MRRLLLCSALFASFACGSNSSSSAVANKCQMPRSGVEPFSGLRYPDQQGSAADEKEWLRRWIDELYLWYPEVPKNLKAQDYTVLQWFDQLKTPAKTPSGKPKDQFHFTFGTAKWNALSQSGVEAGYGAEFGYTAIDVPREVMTLYTEAGSPATAQGIGRGARVVKVDSEPVVDGDRTKLDAGLFPANPGETHVLTILDRGASTPRDVTLTSAAITSAPVQNVHLLPGTTIGYMLVNTFASFSAEKALADAVAQLKSAGATDLMLDLRYNGGGLVAISSQLAYMVGSPARTSGKTFEKLTFNDRNPGVNPVTGGTLTPVPFYSTGVGWTLPVSQALPHLNLDRVFILTGSRTASASESVINGLLGVDEQVILIGRVTRGKPYGFYPQDNCGTTYFSIEFEGQNQKGFGDYPDGFVPGGGGPTGPPGCIAADDYTHDLGDPAEGRLAAALGYRDNQTCPPVSSSRAVVLSRGGQEDAILRSNPLRENRLYLWPRR